MSDNPVCVEEPPSQPAMTHTKVVEGDKVSVHNGATTGASHHEDPSELVITPSVAIATPTVTRTPPRQTVRWLHTDLNWQSLLASGKETFMAIDGSYVTLVALPDMGTLAFRHFGEHSTHRIPGHIWIVRNYALIHEQVAITVQGPAVKPVPRGVQEHQMMLQMVPLKCTTSKHRLAVMGNLRVQLGESGNVMATCIRMLSHGHVGQFLMTRVGEASAELPQGVLALSFSEDENVLELIDHRLWRYEFHIRSNEFMDRDMPVITRATSPLQRSCWLGPHWIYRSGTGWFVFTTAGVCLYLRDGTKIWEHLEVSSQHSEAADLVNWRGWSWVSPIAPDGWFLFRGKESSIAENPHYTEAQYSGITTHLTTAQKTAYRNPSLTTTPPLWCQYMIPTDAI